jgi:selenocysteine lyase/cysteine desulfurase
MKEFLKEIESYRRDTPGVSKVVHLNNAGASLPPEPVIRTVVEYIHQEAQIGGYEAAAEAQDRFALTYQHLAQLIGAKMGEIAFADSGSRAWNNILYSLRFSPGDRILTSQNEFGGNALSLAHVASRTGATIEVVPNDPDGRVSVAELKRRLDSKVKLVAITHVPAHRGVINPVAEIGALLQSHPAFYLVDACQSVGQMVIDVNQIGCDALTAAGRKWLRGPRGTGFLYLRENWVTKIEPAMVDLSVADLTAPELMLRDTRLEIRRDIKRFELWERSFALMLGLGSAAEYALKVGVERIQRIVTELASTIRREVSSIRGIRIEDAPDTTCGIVTLSSSRHDIDDLKKALSTRGINTSVVHDYDGPLELSSRNLRAALRVSPHYYNSAEDIQRFLEAIQDLHR